MSVVRRVYKYGTGQEIPDGAVYLNTVTQTQAYDHTTSTWVTCWLVWHYFLVEVPA